jgi:hypothetical protein
MKLFSILALSALAFISCKKDRTCTCEISKISSTGVTAGTPYVDSGPFSSTSEVYTMPKVTKKEARANCISGEYVSTTTDPYGDTKTETFKRDCVLK